MAGIDAENNHQKEPSYDMARCLEALAPDRQSPGAALRRTRDHGVAGLIRLVFARLWRRADSHVSGVPLGIPGAGALARFRWTVLIVRMYRCAHNRSARRYERPSGPDRLEREDLDNRTGRRRVYWLGHPHRQKVHDVLVRRGPQTRCTPFCRADQARIPPIGAQRLRWMRYTALEKNTKTMRSWHRTRNASGAASVAFSPCAA